MKSSQTLSRTALVACDMTYAAGHLIFPPSTTLQPYHDTSPPLSPRFDYDRTYALAREVDDKPSGFKCMFFKNDAGDLLVAFGGTDGIDYRDWAANSVALGWSQWLRNRDRVIESIDELSRGGVVHFTGQSLGGALAEYAAYEWIDRGDIPTRQARATITTFNGLGSEEGISANLLGGGPVDHSILGRVSQSAAYWVRNDIVTRLGEGHSGIPVYELDHRSTRLKPEFMQARDSQYWDLHPVDAHRIEFGFYPALWQSQDFTRAFEYSPAMFQSLEIHTRESQRMMRMTAAVFNGKFSNETEAAANIAAALISGIALGSPSELTTFAREALKAYHRAGSFSHDNASEMQAREGLWWVAERLPWGEILQAVALRNAPITFALYAGAVGAALGARDYDPQTWSTAFQNVANISSIGVIPATLTSRWLRGLLELRGLAPGADAKSSAVFDGYQISLDRLEAALAGDEATWLHDVASTLLDQATASIRSSTPDLKLQAQRIENYAATLLSWLVDNKRTVDGLDVAYSHELQAQLEAFVGEDVVQALVNVGDVLQPVHLAHASIYGGTALDFASYDRYRDALADAIANPAFADAKDLLSNVLARVEWGGQRVVIDPTGSANPFDAPTFNVPDAVASANVREGQARTFRLFIPYAADGGGQDVLLSLGGAAAGQFTIEQHGVALPRTAAGEFVAHVSAGSRQAVVSVRNTADIDVDVALTMTAQFADDAGTATHRRHDEVLIAFDALVEPTTNPANAVSGTAQDDNRNGDATHRPVNGTATADHIRLLAGRDEGVGAAGDDVIEGGPGADIVRGNDGNDRLFADAAMDDATLRSYIASTAAIVDNTHAPAVIDASGVDWLIGELGDDTIVGTASTDVILGGGGSDLLVGGAGHDDIHGDAAYAPASLTGVTITRNYDGNPHDALYSPIETGSPNYYTVGGPDVIHAGSGDDMAFGGRGEDTIFGDEGDDIITGAEDDDSLFGGPGNDHIAGGLHGVGGMLRPSGNDYIDGGAGDDRLQGESGADVIIGGAGNDILQGFIGTTFVGGNNEDPASDGSDYLSGGAGNDELVGYAGDDALEGGEGNDLLFGDAETTPVALRGNDVLDGGGGDDYLRGYEGNDELLGGTGQDQILGEDGDDAIDGGDEDDLLGGDAGDDVIVGAGGDDKLVGGDGADQLDGGVDDDSLWGDVGDDRLSGGAGDDFIDGGDGVDTIAGDVGADLILAGTGNDEVSGGADADRLAGAQGADRVSGDDGDDQLWGEADDDTLVGGGDNDQLVGGDGNDTLDGGSGADVLFGEAGDDTLYGAAGRDFLIGGAGNDVYIVDDESGEDVIVDDEGQNTVRFGDGVLAGELRFRQGVDASGNDRYLVIEGAATRSRVVVRNGIDATVQRFEFADGTSLTHAQVMADLSAQGAPSKKPVEPPQAGLYVRHGTPGNDVIAPLDSDDSIYAAAGDDVVNGGPGADALDGGAGADRLDGGAGDDVLIGGDGTDTYLFGRDRGRDAIEERFVSQTGATELDTLELAAGIVPADVTLHRDGADLVVAINQTVAQLRVRNHFVTTETVFNPVTGRNEAWPSDRRIETIRFPDGTAWNAAAIASRTIVGTPNTMTGTAGNDTFAVDDAGDSVNEAANAGTDTINASVSYALRRNVERLNLNGFVDLNAWSTPGNAVSYLTGNAGNNVFNGPGTYYDAAGLAVTTLSGATMGYAVMTGGAGDDSYHLRDTIGGQVVENAGEGRDLVVLNGVNWMSYTLPANVEALISAEAGVGQLQGVRYRTGNALDNYLEGSRLANGGLANVLDGGVGADTMVGFAGNDRYLVDNARDVLIDRGVTASGAQQSTADEAWSRVNYELPDNIENLVLTGTAATSGWGNDLANTLDGSQNAAANQLAGGLGNDWYKVAAGDIVVERPGEGIDTVQWHGTGARQYTAADLPDNIEGLAFADDLGSASYSGDGRMDRVTGNASDNVLDGDAGDDELNGGAGNDVLTGGAGDDTLSGGSGYDVMHFSRGFGEDLVWNDVDYELRFDDTIAVSDFSVVGGELHILGTSDTIKVVSAPNVRFADGTFYSASDMFTMIAASKSTTPTSGPDMLRGTSAGEMLDALDGDDFVYAADGDDTVVGGNGHDRLYGEGGHDTLRGDDGNDAIDGGAGNDVGRGGAGRDTLRGDVGQDDLDGGLDDDTLYGHADADRLAGGGGTWDSLYGGDGDDLLTLAGGSGYAAGELGNDRLSGGPTFDSLDGGGGDDRLDGGGGDDVLSGGMGVDVYVLARAQGVDQLQDPAFAGELTVIEAEAGIAPTDIELSRSQDEYGNLTMQVRLAGVGDGFDLPQYGLADRPLEIRFADGTVWSPSMVMDKLARIDGTPGDDALTGTDLGDRLFGLAGNDALTALAGDDFLDGGTGSDTMDGGDGNDAYVVDVASDTIVEVAGAGVDAVQSYVSLTLAANVEQLALLGTAASGTGNASGNTITGNALDNLLDGKAGADTLIGGAGNDSYVVDHALDSVIENAAEGSDIVSSSATLTLGANVEHLTLTGSLAISGTGNALDNTLRGNAAANTLSGLDGNDTLDGGAGADQLRGGKGDDNYTVDHASDAITELAGEGVDRVNATVSYTLAAEVEQLTLTGTAAINATGNALANQLTGNAGANVLDGKAGADTMRGGLGNDTYLVDVVSDAPIENAGEGTDTIQSAITWTLAANLENLTLAGTAAINGTGNAAANVLQGNAAANVLDGGGGADTLRGGAGNDSYVVDSVGDVVTENAAEGTDVVNAAVTYTLAGNVENLTLTGSAAINATGNTLANVLQGNAAANTLNGGAGSDTMRGAAGDDVYVVDATTDAVLENASEGNDTVQSSVAWTLGANVEHLTLTGAAAIDGTGNALANTLQGNAAANVLNGGAGADTLRGGAGNDVLVVDNAADVVVENLNEGDDTVQSYLTWALGAHVENLALVGTAAINGTGNALGNWLQGNAAANVLDASDGQDLLSGGLGNDTLTGGNGHDIMQGGDGNDVLNDASGNNLLHGGIGADTLTGGANNELFAGGTGNDTITTGLGADIVAFNRGDGQDVVNASGGSDNTLSLGGGIRYADVSLLKSGNDLVVEVGASEQLTFRDWYLTAANRHLVSLQMIVDASTDWNAASANPLYSKRVARFDFAGLVSRYDAARASDPTLTRWSVAGALVDFHLGGSDTAAIGGDLGYQFGHANAFTGISWNAVDPVFASASFGSALQTLQATTTLFAGGKTLQ